MRVLSYDPSNGFFFVDVTWDEYRRLAAQYEIDTGDSKEGAEEVIEIQKVYREEMATGVFTESYPFQQYLKDLYGIDDMPEVCLGVKKDLSYLWVDQYDYPFGHMWNGSSPWIRMEPAVIRDLSDLAALECVKRGDDGGMEKNTASTPDSPEFGQGETIEYRIREERISAAEYIEFLKRTDLGSQYPKERFAERIPVLLERASISLTARDAEERLTGVCLGITDFAYWLFLTDLGVVRECTGQGIGTALVRRALALAGGEENIILYTCANENAVPFYEKLGMTRPNDMMVYDHAEWTPFTVE